MILLESRVQRGGLSIAVFRPNEDNPLTNEDIAGLEIRTKTGLLTADRIWDTTGILKRYRAAEINGIPKKYSDTETVKSMAIKAAEQVLDGRRDIDVFLMSSSFPQTTSLTQEVAEELGLQPKISKEVGAACSGVPRALYYLWENRAHLERAKVLCLASEMYSPYLKPIDQTIFSDGAVAMVFEMGKDLEILHAQKDSLEGKEHEGIIKMPINRDLAQRRPDYIEEKVAESESGFFDQDGARVVGAIRRFIGPIITNAVRQAGLKIEDINLVIPHQPSKIGLDVLSRSAPDFNFFRDIEEGNWSSGSIPKALARAIQEGAVHGGEKVVLSGFGAGETIFTSTTVVQLAA